MFLSDLKSTSQYLNLDPVFYHKVKPAPLYKPHLVSFNPKAADLIGLDYEVAQDQKSTDFVNGRYIAPKTTPYAMCYAGHQFGYSRGGDGRAVLRSSIREYLMSEAMHGLGIPTTRALAIIGSQDKIIREDIETGAIVLRMSPSWIRFGSFEYFYHNKEYNHLMSLADYVIKESFPHLVGEPDAYIRMFKEVVAKTAKLMAQWQAVGFNHGVMNTDNMSIGGFTIDYGPYAFLDDYDFNYICNHTDEHGRYSFGNQPYIAEWNLSMLLTALSPLVNIDRLKPVLLQYRTIYQESYIRLLREKLGLFSEMEKDTELIQMLFDILQNQRVDYTLFFRTLSHYSGERTALSELMLLKKPLEDWLDIYDQRLTKEQLSGKERSARMQKINPKYVLKNYILQEAIDAAAEGDFSVVQNLLKLAQTPYDEHPEFEHYAQATPTKYKNLKLSCSS